MVSPQRGFPCESGVAWNSADAARNFTYLRRTITLFGSKVHFAALHREFGEMDDSPQEFDGVLKNPKKLAAFLAAFDKIPAVAQPETIFDSTYEQGCLTRAGKQRCVHGVGRAPDGADMRALRSIYATLIEGLSITLH